MPWPGAQDPHSAKFILNLPVQRAASWTRHSNSCALANRCTVHSLPHPTSPTTAVHVARWSFEKAATVFSTPDMLRPLQRDCTQSFPECSFIQAEVFAEPGRTRWQWACLGGGFFGRRRRNQMPARQVFPRDVSRARFGFAGQCSGFVAEPAQVSGSCGAPGLAQCRRRVRTGAADMSSMKKRHDRNWACSVRVRLLKAILFAQIKKASDMHPFLEELIPIKRAHAHFANWERAKHRAEFFCKNRFPG